MHQIWSGNHHLPSHNNSQTTIDKYKPYLSFVMVPWFSKMKLNVQQQKEQYMFW
jgi:hypothetical protein